MCHFVCFGYSIILLFVPPYYKHIKSKKLCSHIYNIAFLLNLVSRCHIILPPRKNALGYDIQSGKLSYGILPFPAINSPRILILWLRMCGNTYVIIIYASIAMTFSNSITAPQHLVCRAVQSLHINHMQAGIIEVFKCRHLHMSTSTILICIWLVCTLCTTLHTKCCGAVYVSTETALSHYKVN